MSKIIHITAFFLLFFFCEYLIAQILTAGVVIQDQSQFVKKAVVSNIINIAVIITILKWNITNVI